jgi:hypothetical protein
MRSLAGWAAVFLGAAVVIWILRIVFGSSKHRQGDQYVIVAPDEAKLDPYPYVYVNADGSARELHPNERKHLETFFDPFGGGGPPVKYKYSQKLESGQIAGFLRRSKLPRGMEILRAPAEDPSKPLSREEEMQLYRDKGLDVVEHVDGRGFTVRKPDGTVVAVIVKV